MEQFKKAHKARRKSTHGSIITKKNKHLKNLLRKYEESFTKILLDASDVVGHIPKNKRGEALLRMTRDLTNLKEKPKPKSKPKKESKVKKRFDPSGELATRIQLNLIKHEGGIEMTKEHSMDSDDSNLSESDSISESEIMRILKDKAKKNNSSSDNISDGSSTEAIESNSDEEKIVIDEEYFPGKYVLKPPTDAEEIEDNENECVRDDDDNVDCDEDISDSDVDAVKENDNDNDISSTIIMEDAHPSKNTGEIDEKMLYNEDYDDAEDIDDSALYDDIVNPSAVNADDMLYDTAFESTTAAECVDSSKNPTETDCEDVSKCQQNTSLSNGIISKTKDIQQQVANLHNVTIEPVTPVNKSNVNSTQESTLQKEEEVVELLSSDDETDQKPDAKESVPIEENPADNYDEVQFYAAGQQVVIVLRHPVRLYFWGKFSVSLLFGEVCILGHTLQKFNTYDMYSPRGLGKLYFETIPSEEPFNPMLLFPILAETNLNAFNSEQIVTSISENDVVLHLQSNNNILTSYFNFLNVNPKPFPTALRAPSISENYYNSSLQTFFYKNECNMGINIGENWYDLCHHIFSTVHNAKILVCGGKGVGKSTFNRFLINTQVQSTPVIYIDLDLGQPEFGFPGTISASMIEEPIFGPSYTHVQTKFLYMKFIRHIDVMKDTSLYLHSIKDMMAEIWSKYHEYPWIINTMGFVKSFGDSINIAAIKLTKPTFVIQIHDNDAKNNYDCYMRPETVHQYKCQNLGIHLPQEQIHFNHMLIMSETQSMSRNNNHKQNRDMNVISYFSHMLTEDKFHLTQYKPLQAKFENLKIWTLDSLAPNLIASSLNTNIVAFCNVGKDVPTTNKCGLQILPTKLRTGLNCLGFGIVRGISKETIYLLTPLSLEQMKHVNCIANCTQTIPMNMLTKLGNQVKGHAPFLSIKRDRPEISNVPKRNYYMQRNQANRTPKDI